MIPLYLIEKDGTEFEFQLPESMNEMTVKQLEFLAGLVANTDPIQEIKTKMLLFCMGAKLKRLRKKDVLYRIRAKRHTFKLQPEHLLQAVSHFDYLFIEGQGGNCFLDTRLTVCPVSKIRLAGFWTFYAPAEALTDIVYDRYVFLETYFDRMQEEPAMVYAFLGAMLRPREKQFRKDRLFLGLMRLLHPRKVVLLSWFFIGSIRFIKDKFPKVFPESGGSKDKGGTLYDDQQRLLDFIAKADPDKKIRMKHTNLYEVLYSLNFIMEEAEKQKKDMERLKNRSKR